MNHIAAERLRDIVTSEGREIIGEPRRLEALLSDRCAEYRLEVNLLSAALNEGVPDTLVRSSEGGAYSTATVERLATQLESSRGMEREKARWAVDSWAAALNLTPSGHGSMPSPREGPAEGGRTVTAGAAEVTAAPPPRPTQADRARVEAILVDGDAVTVGGDWSEWDLSSWLPSERESLAKRLDSAGQAFMMREGVLRTPCGDVEGVERLLDQHVADIAPPDRRRRR